MKYVVADFVTANVAVFVFDIARYRILGSQATGFTDLPSFLCAPILVAEQMLLPLMALFIYLLSGYYNKPFHKSHVQEMFLTFGSSMANTLLIYFALLVNSRTSIRMTSYELLFYLFAALFISCFAGRFIVTRSTARRMRLGRLRFNVAVAGNNARGQSIAEGIMANSSRTGYRFAGFIALPGEDAATSACDMDGAPAFCKSHDIYEVVVAPLRQDESYLSELLNPLFKLMIPLKVSAMSVPALSSSIKLQSIYEEPYIDITSANITESTRNIKRFLDIILSAGALTVLMLPMAVIALAVRRDSPGGVIFRQERIGYHGKPFTIYKFRSMRTDAEKHGPRLSSDNDTRITRIGHFLRKYRLDELPQFWNVLKGDMSIVGPRPERRHFIDKIIEVMPQYALIHQVRPGITSWGMVKYGYASSVGEMVERVRYDLVYLANMSITADTKILIYTVKTIIKGRGK